MKKRNLILAIVVLAICFAFTAAQAEGYTEFCTLDAHFTWLESANVRTEPYTSSSTTGKTVTAGDVVFIDRLVKNEYGNLWAELSQGGYLCFYDKASEKVCASFVGFNNGAAPVTTSNLKAPEGEIAQGTSFTFSGILDSTDVCPIFLFDIWCGPSGGNSFGDPIQDWPSGVTTQIDITDYNINDLYDISTLPPGDYTYMIRVWMGFTYEGYMFSFGDKYVPVQKNFTITEKSTSYTVPSGSLSTKLAYLRNVFPDGWYWNHWTDSKLGNTYTMKSFTVNGNATTISTKPCDKSSSLHANVSNSTCNHYWGSWKGVQCTGFARMMFELVWDMDTETASYGMYYHPDTDNADLLDYVKPGDMVWTGGHMFLVTAVNGDNFTVVHCNRNSNCNIEWDYTYTKDWVHARMKGNGTGYVASPTPIVYGSDITNWAKYQVVTSSLNVRKWASTSVDKSCTMQKGDYFYVDLNHTITKSGNLYGYCRTADGNYGWVQYANTSYAVPVEECEHANTELVVIKMCSCTEEGLEHYTCTDCGEVLETYIVPAADHFEGEWAVSTQPTCTVDGESYLPCLVCGAVLDTEVIPANGHTEGEWVVITEATATTTGLKRQSCTVCGTTLKEEAIPAAAPNPLSNITMSASSNLTALPGGTVTVPVSINNPDGVALGAVEISYELPSGVTIASVNLGSCAVGAMIVNTNPTAIVTTTNAITDSGKLLDLVLAIDDSVPLPAQITVSPSVISTGGNTLVTLSPFHITLEEAGLPGDVNEDGTVNLVDIMQTARYVYVDSTMSINLRNADVNEDGIINLVDIMRIARIVYPA